MNKLDLLILTGAGLMIATAAGLWFGRDQVMILSPLRPSSDIPVFRQVDEKEYEAERRRIAVVTPRPGDSAADTAFLKAARRLRNSPCSGPARTEYLAAMTVYARTDLRENLEAARRGEDDRPKTSLEAQASEYFDHMHMHGYISSGDFREAMKQVSPGIGMAMAMSEARGETMDMAMGGNACDRRRRGEPQPGLSWEPQDDGRPEGVRRR